MGYTPLFDTMLTGTLHGRWPHTGVWACLLSRVSREGLIDETPQSLAGAIGIPVDLLKNCIQDFMSPDPDSRTAGNDGRRLELIDPHRSWGWRVLNHQKYKEKARKKNYDETRTETGADAERKRLQREGQEDVPRSPAKSRDGPLSSPTPTPSPTPEKTSERASAPDDAPPKSKRGTRVPERFEITDSLRKWLAQKCPHVNAEDATEEFIRYWKAIPGQRGCKLDWAATWQNRMVEVEARAAKSAPRPFGRVLTYRPTE